MKGIEKKPEVPGSAIPQVFSANYRFTIVENGKDVGNQVFTCDEKVKCDQIYTALEKMKYMDIKYLRSKTGLVVIQGGDNASDSLVATMQNVLDSY